MRLRSLERFCFVCAIVSSVRPDPFVRLVQATAIGLTSIRWQASTRTRHEKSTAALGDDEAAAMAIGYPGDPETLPEKFRQRELTKCVRKPIADLRFAGQWGRPSPIVAG